MQNQTFLASFWQYRTDSTSINAVALTILLLLYAGTVATKAADSETIPRVVFLGFQLINTSLEPTTRTEDQRVRMLDDLFRQKLEASGRFKMMPVSLDLQKTIDAGAEISNCNGCERAYAQKAGADLAAWGTVQKVSNLILNINVYIEDVHAEKLTFVKSVDVRGNTDESWRHGLDYLLRHYLFGEP